jgi:hypothetical protein
MLLSGNLLWVIYRTLIESMVVELGMLLGLLIDSVIL